MSASIRRFINSIPSNRTALELQKALDLMLPTGKDTAVVAGTTQTQTGATALRTDCSFHNVITVATASDGIALPLPKIGDFHFVKNSAAANAMKVYAATPGTIDSTATATGVTQLAGDAVLYFCQVDGDYLRLGGVQATEVFTTLTATTGNITTVNATNIDAGASGTAGSVDVFPATASKGKLAITVTDQTGDTTASVVIGAMSAARTITLRDPGAAASILTTTDATAAATTATAVQLSRCAVTTAGTAEASKVAVLGADKNLDEFHTAALYLGAAAGTLVASTAAQLDAAVAGTPLVYRTTVPAAAINTGTASYVVPAIAGKRFQVMHISMAATLGGGNVAGPTTVEVIEETAGTVFLSHVTADLTDGVWHNLVTGTPVITGITNGGMTSADNKGLLVTCTGGTPYATSTGLDVVVVGYYTTT